MGTSCGKKRIEVERKEDRRIDLSPKTKKKILKRIDIAQYPSFKDDSSYISLKREPIKSRRRKNLSFDFKSQKVDVDFNFKLVFDDFSVGMIIVDEKGSVVYKNDIIDVYLSQFSDEVDMKINSIFGKRINISMIKPFNIENDGRHFRIKTQKVNFNKNLLLITFEDITEFMLLKVRLLIADEKNNRLINSILPPTIVERIRAGEEKIADFHDGVAIGFCDIVEFTPMVSKMTPLELFSMLNDIFSSYDEIAKEIGVHKVETAGDNYMISCGIFGEEMVVEKCIFFMKRAIDYTNSNHFIKIRAGINYGSVATGVVGSIRPHFGVFGDTVNIASRMESHGESNKIQITRDALFKIKSIDDFEIVANGEKKIKGKDNPIKTYFVSPKLSF